MADDNPMSLDARERRNANPERLLTFTDGVFAIIITILVLEMKVPDLASAKPLSDALVEIRPTFVAFVISFLLVGMYWVGHRSSFAALLRLALDSYIYRHPGLLWQQSSKRVRQLVTIVTAAPLVAYAIAMIVATWIPWLSLLFYFSIPLLYFVFVTVLKTDPRTRLDAEDLS